MRQMLDVELAGIVGAKHAKLDQRVGNWHGTTKGQVVLGARKISIERPRGRYVDGGEVELDTWATFASEDLLRQVVVERMPAGVATRRHVEVAEPVAMPARRCRSRGCHAASLPPPKPQSQSYSTPICRGWRRRC